MKQTNEALSRAQDQAVLRRHLLESGQIRLVRETTKAPHNAQTQRQPRSSNDPKEKSK